MKKFIFMTMHWGCFFDQIGLLTRAQQTPGEATPLGSFSSSEKGPMKVSSFRTSFSGFDENSTNWIVPD
jgi:hypothetical protein